jgi:type I restriction enzyme S subunit
MSEWKVEKFQALAHPDAGSFSIGPFGSAITTDNYVPEGVPVVRGVNLARGIFVDDQFVYISDKKADELSRSNLIEGDLVFTHRGTIGQVSMIPRTPRFRRYVLSSSQVKARLDPDRAVPEFYYYWFRSPEGKRTLLANASVVGVPGIGQPLATIKSLEIPYPPVQVQKAIASILGALDHKIAVNGRIATVAHELAQAHLAHAHETAGLAKLSEIAEITMGSSPPGESYNEDGIGMPFYQGTRDFGDRFPGRRVWCTSPVRAASPGSCLVSVRAPVGRVNIALELCCIGRGVAAVQSKHGTPCVLFHELSAARDIWLPFESEGTVFGAINKQQLADISIKALDPESARVLDGFIEPLDQRVAVACDENMTLAALRDALLPKLMSGAIRVRDAEKVVEDVT